MPHLKLLRPEQWIKNVFLFAGVIFGRKFTDPGSDLLALCGFAIFCLLSSGVYVMNDIKDREEDRLHPRKSRRPIASGEVTVQSALGISITLVIGSLLAAFALDRGFFLCCIGYFILQTCYTFAFKHEVLLDVIIIGIGFVLRAVAGAVLVHVEISHWLLICTFTLCLFMGFSKRRCELTAMAGANGGEAHTHRRSLAQYTPDLLNHMTTLTAGIAVVSFMLYTVDQRTVAVYGTPFLVFTLPLVVYAIFRFALLVEHGRVDGPTDVILRDRPFQISIVLWLAAATVIISEGRRIAEWMKNLSV